MLRENEYNAKKKKKKIKTEKIVRDDLAIYNF